MKSKILSRALAVAASAAMLATMATTGFAAAGTTTDVSVDDSTVTSYSASIGTSFVADAVIYNSNSNVTDDVGAKAEWSVIADTNLVTKSIAELPDGANATQIDGSSTPTLASIQALADANSGAGTVALATADVDTADTFAKLSVVAGTDGKSVKVTPQAATADTFNVVYYTDGSGAYFIQYNEYDVSTLALHLESTYGTGAGNTDTQDVALTITDSRYLTDLFDASKTTAATSAFDLAKAKAATGVTVDDDVVTSINVGSSTQVTYKLLQAIYNQEEAVDLVSGDFTFTIDGLNMSSIGSSATAANVMTLSVSTSRLSRTVRNNIADASKEYGADFAVAVPEDPDDYDYYPLDLSDITIPDAVDSVAITFDPDDVYEGGDLADYAADGELYMYLYDDGEFTLFDTVDTTGRRDSLLTFELEDGDQGLYILTTTKLEAGSTASSEAPASSEATSSDATSSASSTSSETIPNTGDANVVAIAVMMAVIALGGAAVVAKKATK